ncbi:hypothetical protein HC928_23980, partial [bacterium]|nr:hypothetical protein [bacterium]
MFNEALDRHSRGDDRKAGDLLGKALKMNPALARDPYIISTAAAISGIDGTTAVERLMAEQRKPKSQPVAVPSQWSEAVLDVAIYGLISAGGTFALFLIVSRLIWPEFESAIALNPALANSQSLLETFFNNIWAFVVFSAAAGFYFIYTLLVQNVFVHFAAVSLLGGRGEYPVLLSKTSVVGIASNIFIMIIVVGIFILLPEGFAPNLARGISDLFIYDNFSGEYVFSNNILVLEATFTQLFNAISSLCCVGILGLLASNYFFSRAIGRTYRMGAARGFFALLLAGIIMQLVGQFIVNPVVNLVFSLDFPIGLTWVTNR